jgi:predicted MFS family arabinose efflux permease
MIVAPRAGRLIDKIGERYILLLNYTGVLLVFLGYIFTKSVIVMSILYCLDSILFNFSIALTTYIDKISLPGDLSPNISMGITANHVAAVMMPIIGGMLWEKFNYQMMFMLGAIVVTISIFMANRVDPLRA